MGLHNPACLVPRLSHCSSEARFFFRLVDTVSMDCENLSEDCLDPRSECYFTSRDFRDVSLRQAPCQVLVPHMALSVLQSSV